MACSVIAHRPATSASALPIPAKNELNGPVKLIHLCCRGFWHSVSMDVLSSRILLRPTDRRCSQNFYRDVLGLAVYRQFGDPENPGVVFFLGNGLLEISGEANPGETPPVSLWLQVRDVDAEHERLTHAGATVRRGPVLEPWGLREMWLEDPDGVRIVVVEVPEDHPLRRDQRQ